MGGGLVGPHGDPRVLMSRMVPRDSQGASWGFLGPQGAQKGVFGFFGGGGGGPGGPPVGALLLALSWANRPY